MGFYDNKETANQYIEMAKGYDGRDLIAVLRQHVPDGATVLELGMGPGVDLDILAEYYRVTGSDLSQFFIDRYRQSNPHADLMLLDAVELQTDRAFDCIYSNKVLHHLAEDDLCRSVQRQCELLTENGCVMHSFWRGEGVDEHHGLRFAYQTEESVRKIFCSNFASVVVETYTEMDDDDSLYVVAKAKKVAHGRRI